MSAILVPIIEIGDKTYEYIENVLWNSEEFEEISEEIVDQGRWTTYYEYIIRHKESDRIYSISYGRGSTESQDNDEEAYVQEVRKVEKIITAYEVIEGATQ